MTFPTLNRLILVVGLFTGSLLSAQFQDLTVQKEIHTRDKGMVVSAHPLASQVGAKILRDGGNAFDAAIATQYALAVVYPQAGNLGGGGFLIGIKNSGEKIALDFRETAPEKAHRNMYIDKEGNPRTDWSQEGSLAVGVPGSVAGFFATLPHANLPMEKLIAPAIELAEKGFALTQREAELLNRHKEEFLKNNSMPTAFVKQTPWKEGDLLIQKDLGKTLRRIQQLGLAGFYEGETAKEIVTEISKGKGIVSYKDLKNYKVRERQPLEFVYKGHQVISMPLPSSGGILLAQMLKMSSYENLEKYEFHSQEALQIMIEAERRAYADRAEYMGDPDFVEDPTKKLLAESYLKGRWENFRFSKATPSSEVGKIYPQAQESTETTHLSVLDKDLNAVSVTTTLNGLYGSKVVAGKAGFFLNNEMDDFSIKPGTPNMFGAIGGEANKIEPGKRMLSSMTPTIVLKDSQPYIVVGTPGGTTIPTSVYQTLVNLIDFKLDANKAVNAAKFHHQWLPENVKIEKGFHPEMIKALANKNYSFESVNQIGRTELIVRYENGAVVGVADGRGDDSVATE